MKESEKTDIALLVDRFLDGETTLEEEHRLYAFFQQDEVPEEWTEYKEMFRDYAALDFHAPGMEAKESRAIPSGKAFALFARYAASVAAILLTVFVIGQAMRVHEERQLAAHYGGSYMIVDGVRIDDLAKIQASIKDVLSESRCIEQEYSAAEEIRKAEQDILDGIKDESEREHISKLLK